MLSIHCMLLHVEILDTHDMSNKCIQSNFFVVMFYLTLTAYSMHRENKENSYGSIRLKIERLLRELQQILDELFETACLL